MGGAHDAPARTVDRSVSAQKIAQSDALQVGMQWNMNDFMDCIDHEEHLIAAGDAHSAAPAAVATRRMARGSLVRLARQIGGVGSLAQSAGVKLVAQGDAANAAQPPPVAARHHPAQLALASLDAQPPPVAAGHYLHGCARLAHGDAANEPPSPADARRAQEPTAHMNAVDARVPPSMGRAAVQEPTARVNADARVPLRVPPSMGRAAVRGGGAKPILALREVSSAVLEVSSAALEVTAATLEVATATVAAPTRAGGGGAHDLVQSLSAASEGGESEQELHADMDAYLEAGGYDSDERGNYSDRHLHEAMDAYLYSGGDDPDPECTLRDAVDSYFQPDASASERSLHDAMADYLYSGGDNPDPERTLHDAVDSYFERDAG